jgi:hypothetical protein
MGVASEIAEGIVDRVFRREGDTGHLRKWCTILAEAEFRGNYGT